MKEPNRERKTDIKSISAVQLNEEQKEAKTNILYHPYNFIMGKAGSGKTLLAVQVALDMYFKRMTNKIIITDSSIFGGKLLTIDL